MRYAAAALFTLLALTSCAHRAKYEFATNWTYTAPPPTPSPTPLKGERAITIPNLPGEQGPVTTRVNISPQFDIRPARPIHNARLMWSVSIAPSPAPPGFSLPRIIAWRNDLYVSAGTDLSAVNAANGTRIWHHNSVGTPFAVSESFVVAASENRVYAFFRRRGGRAWQRTACTSDDEVGDVAIDGDLTLILCKRNAVLVALDLYTGRLRYSRTLLKTGAGERIQVLEPGSVSVSAGFNGAWMGTNDYLLHSRDGLVVFDKTNVEVLQVRDGSVEFNDQCCFERSSTYEPAKLFWVNLRTGIESRENTLAPDKGRFTNLYGEPTNGEFGTVFLSGDSTYLSYGEMLYRYSSLTFHSPEVLLDDFEHAYYAHNGIVIAVLYGYPTSVAARIDLSKPPYKVRPLVAIPWAAGIVDREPALDRPAITADVFGGKPFAIVNGSVGIIPLNCGSNGATQIWQGAAAVICFSNDQPQLRLYSVND